MLNNNFLTENCQTAFIFEPKSLVQFKTAWDWQVDWRDKMMKNSCQPHAIWLLEHEPCYTIGRGSDYKNVLFDINDPLIKFHKIDRGGDVTHHMDGQLVVYLVFDLNRFNKDLNWYLRELEQVIIDLLDIFQLNGQRKNGLTGVWCQNKKITSIGIGCKKWITQHGFALNVNCDLGGYKKINPCGLSSNDVGKLDEWVYGITVNEIKPLIKQCIINRFSLNICDEIK